MVDLENPPWATSLVLTFGLYDDGNDWWWAIDNVEVSGSSGGSPVQLLMEDFEGVPLGPSVEEAPPGSFWTDEPPVGWVVDDSGVPGAGDPANDGVTDIDALLAGRPQPRDLNPDGKFELHRIGDAVASRNIHSAMLDALRICSAL